MFINGLFTYMSICAASEPDACGDQKKVLSPLELELQMAVSTLSMLKTILGLMQEQLLLTFDPSSLYPPSLF